MLKSRVIVGRWKARTTGPAWFSERRWESLYASVHPQALVALGAGEGLVVSFGVASPCGASIWEASTTVAGTGVRVTS